MKTILMLITISLLLGPFGAPAQAFAEPVFEGQATTQHDQHDCCLDAEQAPMQMVHAECNDSCNTCQHFCGSSANVMFALSSLQITSPLNNLWPEEITAPIQRQEQELRPPLSA
jgi:hypothetical protein